MNEIIQLVREVVTSTATIVNCTIVIASSQDTLTTVTNNNKEVPLTEKITEDNARFKPHDDHTIPYIERQDEVMIMLTLSKS